MELNMLKELIYTGIGAASILKERVEEEVAKLEAQGKIKSEDAKTFIQSLEENGKKEESKLKEQIKSSLHELIDELDLATKQDLQDLKKELEK
jgi:polyhydroxyalkanoate synthesis regulator phasin